jgi:predicted aldo/keto reductase-like oxidoreductase
MEYRRLGASGLKVPALSFGAGTFGGAGPLFSHWGTSDAKEARRLVDICLEAGVTLFEPPTSIRTVRRKKCSARPSRGGAARC